MSIPAPQHTIPDNRKQTRDTVKGRIVYLLILVALLHFIYPITLGNNPQSQILYQVLYAGMMVVGILVASDSRTHLTIAVTTGVVWLVFAVTTSLDPANTWKTLATYLSLIPFQVTITYLLLRYIFSTTSVNRDVLLAAVSVYILLAAIFVPIYGSLELLRPGSFIDNSTSLPVFWQQFIYFSFVTLTTTGYGDILPVSAWGRALTNIEMVIGVLYIAVLMARLVGLYTQHVGEPSRE